ncbi:MAG: ferrous iron transport protein B [Planctomycetes bacterium]|nr:ferrous iron transport protein B [Planctomycetota bacterium]
MVQAARSGSIDTVTIALIGNPNTGKSTLFSALCGVHQHTGNYPGVTVERKTGDFRWGDRSIELIDLPGTYSLAPRSPDEMITVDVLLGRQKGTAPPRSVLCIVDASNLERNLYLVSQVLELGLPTVVALNMMDVAAARGITIDAGELARRLRIPVVPIQANRRRGLDDLKTALASGTRGLVEHSVPAFPAPFEQAVTELASRSAAISGQEPPRFLVQRLLLDTTVYLSESGMPGINGVLANDLQQARERLATAGCAVPGVEAISRYNWVGEVLKGVVSRSNESRVTASDRIDRLLTHRYYGTAFFVATMALMFQLVYLIAEPANGLLDAAKSWLASVVGGMLAEGPLRSLLVTGVIEGVGSVLVFLPQIFVLFFCIAVLEDCGYMARAAYLMDRLMFRIGLNGKSFIPLLSSFACAIPGIMATRVIENRRDRLVTMLVAPLMSCSARMPIYSLLIATFIPERVWLRVFGLRGLVWFAAYAVGSCTAIVVAMLLKRTLLRGDTPPFVMELPSYKYPEWRVVLLRMGQRGWEFVRRAGTLILAVSILVWAAAYYPHRESDIPGEWRARHAQIQAALDDASGLSETDRAAFSEELSHLDRQIQGEYLRRSWLGMAGRGLEPFVKPLGWDWRIGCAVVASFPAREVVVATLGVIYNLGTETSDQDEQLHAALRNATWEDSGKPVFGIPVALSLIVFFALCAQCGSTLVVMRRETGSWRWPIFTFTYMTSLAYFGAFLSYQIACWCGW